MPHDGSLLARKLGAFIELSRPELDCLADLQATPVIVPRGQEIVHEGQMGHKAYILQQGWAVSFKLLPDGGRQIITFPLPGDCVGLRSVLLRTSDHSFSALTDAVVRAALCIAIVSADRSVRRTGGKKADRSGSSEAPAIES